ncbi:tachylectin-related carbohydrate-binding protein [Streptomyces sp. NPDC002577]
MAALCTLIAPGVPAHADRAVTFACTTPAVSNYHVDGNGQLRRWADNAPLTGNGSWNQAVISTSWNATKTFSGGDGVIFTISPAGDLFWFKDNNYNGTGGATDLGSGKKIGFGGWDAYTTVIGGGDGVIYAVTPDGRLFWYRYLGTAGELSWVQFTGRQIGTGWNSLQRIAASGNGVLYGVTTNGLLRWYRHLGASTGTATWANNGAGLTIGSGWGGFTHLASFGAGVLLTRNSTGTLFWYRHLDPLGGGVTWANDGVGVARGTGWNDNALVTDVTGCRATP